MFGRPPSPGVGKFRFSRGTEFVGLGDDDASLLWSCEKQFSTKELQEAPLPKNHKKLQENHDVFKGSLLRLQKIVRWGYKPK